MRKPTFYPTNELDEGTTNCKAFDFIECHLL